MPPNERKSWVMAAGSYAVRRSFVFPLFAAVLVTVLLVSPGGNFPLNDDWTYGETVRKAIEHHRFEPHPFQVAIAFTQTVWGTLFAGLFGYSYTVLRVSTLVMLLIALWAAARCAQAYGVARGPAVLAALLLLANPLVLNLSYTFMTDITFLAMMTLSGMFYLRAIPEQKTVAVFWGSVFGVFAFLTRQHGLFISAAFAAAVLFLRITRAQRIRARAVLAFGLPWLVCAVAAGVWLAGRSLSSPQVSWITSRIGGIPEPEKLVQAWRYGLQALAYMGLFLLPVFSGRIYQLRSRQGCRRSQRVTDGGTRSVASPTRRERWTRTRQLLLCLYCVVAGISLFTGLRPRLPFISNVLYDLGTGPPTLAEWRGTQFVQIGRWWWPLTALAIVSSGFLLIEALRGGGVRFSPVPSPQTPDPRPNPARAGQHTFLLLWGLFFVVTYMPFLPHTFDRYLITLLVPCCILAMGAWRGAMSRGAKIAIGIPLAALYLVSLVCVQDYMAWNRARWSAIDELMSGKGVRPELIDGGYEFNGLYTGEQYQAQHPTRDWTQWGDPGWWVIDARYSVSFFPREGYAEIGRKPYFSWLGMRQRHILLLERNKSVPPPLSGGAAPAGRVGEGGPEGGGVKDHG